MPRGNGTGPMGMGPMTGRAAGYCAGFGMPGYANPVPGRGFGMGFGRGQWFGRGGGRGWRNMFYATGQPGWMRFGAHVAPYPAPDAKTEKQALEAQAEFMKNEMEEIRKRLEEIEKEVGQQ